MLFRAFLFMSLCHKSSRWSACTFTLCAEKTHTMRTCGVCDWYGQIRMGQLCLVDLAGSERLSMSGAGRDPKQLAETQAINLSLTVLADVLSALAAEGDQHNTDTPSPTLSGVAVPPEPASAPGTGTTASSAAAPHIPYRNSKLTQLLRDAIGGSAKTVFLAHGRAGAEHYRQTLTTLTYASRARAIRGVCRANIATDLTGLSREAAAQVNQYLWEIERLQQRAEETKEQLELAKAAQTDTAIENAGLSMQLHMVQEELASTRAKLTATMTPLKGSTAAAVAVAGMLSGGSRGHGSCSRDGRVMHIGTSPMPWGAGEDGIMTGTMTTPTIDRRAVQQCAMDTQTSPSPALRDTGVEAMSPVPHAEAGTCTDVVMTPRENAEARLQAAQQAHEGVVAHLQTEVQRTRADLAQQHDAQASELQARLAAAESEASRLTAALAEADRAVSLSQRHQQDAVLAEHRQQVLARQDLEVQLAAQRRHVADTQRHMKSLTARQEAEVAIWEERQRAQAKEAEESRLQVEAAERKVRDGAWEQQKLECQGRLLRLQGAQGALERVVVQCRLAAQERARQAQVQQIEKLRAWMKREAVQKTQLERERVALQQSLADSEAKAQAAATAAAAAKATANEHPVEGTADVPANDDAQVGSSLTSIGVVGPAPSVTTPVAEEHEAEDEEGAEEAAGGGESTGDEISVTSDEDFVLEDEVKQPSWRRSVESAGTNQLLESSDSELDEEAAATATATATKARGRGRGRKGGSKAQEQDKATSSKRNKKTTSPKRTKSRSSQKKQKTLRENDEDMGVSEALVTADSLPTQTATEAEAEAGKGKKQAGRKAQKSNSDATARKRKTRRSVGKPAAVATLPASPGLSLPTGADYEGWQVESETESITLESEPVPSKKRKRSQKMGKGGDTLVAAKQTKGRGRRSRTVVDADADAVNDAEDGNAAETKSKAKSSGNTKGAKTQSKGNARGKGKASRKSSEMATTESEAAPAFPVVASTSTSAAPSPIAAHPLSPLSVAPAQYSAPTSPFSVNGASPVSMIAPDSRPRTQDNENTPMFASTPAETTQDTAPTRPPLKGSQQATQQRKRLAPVNTNSIRLASHAPPLAGKRRMASGLPPRVGRSAVVRAHDSSMVSVGSTATGAGDRSVIHRSMFSSVRHKQALDSSVLNTSHISINGSAGTSGLGVGRGSVNGSVVSSSRASVASGSMSSRSGFRVPKLKPRAAMVGGGRR